MCTILDAVEGRGIEKGITQGITQGETLKLIMLVQKSRFLSMTEHRQSSVLHSGI